MAGVGATIPNLSEDVSIEELGDSVELKQVSAQSNQTIFPRSPQFWECLGGDKNGAFKDGFVRFQPSGQVKQTTMSFSHLSNYHARSKNISGPVLQKKIQLQSFNRSSQPLFLSFSLFNLITSCKRCFLDAMLDFRRISVSWR